MDELKQHLRQHRDQLDLSTPDKEVWQQIRQRMQLPRVPVYRRMATWLAAAGIAGILFTGIFWWLRPDVPQEKMVKKNDPVILPPAHVKATDTAITAPAPEDIASQEPTVQETREKPMVVSIPPVKKAATPKHHASGKAKAGALPGQLMDANYASIIAYQVRKLERTPIQAESAEYFYGFKKQWSDLERAETKLRQDAKLTGLNDQMVEEMIRIYQQKLAVLKQLQNTIDKMNVRARQYPAIRRETPAFIKL